MKSLQHLIIPLAECLPTLFVFTMLLPYALSKLQTLLFYIIYVILHISVFGNFSHYSTPILLLCSLAMIWFFSKNNKNINLIFAMLGYLYGVCLNYVIFSILNLFDISIYKIQSKHPIIFCLSFTLFFYIASYFPQKLIRRKIPVLNLNSSHKLSKFLLIEVLVCCTIFIFNIIVSEYLEYPMGAFVMNTFLFFVLFVCTTLILFQIIQVMKKESLAQTKLKEYETMADYTNQIENLYINLNQVRHDYPNIILSLYNFIEEKDLPGLEHYYFSKILPLETELSAMDSVLKELTNIKCTELKSILYTKLITAHNQNIKISLLAPDPIAGISMDTLDLIRIIGIFLDNAMEAAVESDDPSIEVSVLALEKSIKFKIGNTCAVEKVPLDSLYQFGKSSKGSSRGIGLHSALTIIETYENIISNTTSQNFCFLQELTIVENQQ